jgi:hypothetical protein
MSSGLQALIEAEAAAAFKELEKSIQKVACPRA